MRLNIVSLWCLLVAGIGLMLANTAPEWGAFAVLVAMIAIAVTYRAYFHPAIVLTIGPTAMLLIGGLNISHYRGLVPSEVFGYILSCIMLLAVGAGSVLLMSPNPPRKPPRSPDISYAVIVMSLLPGLLGVAWIVLTVGIPLISPNARFLADPKALFLAETATVPAVLLAYRYYVHRSFPGRDRLLAGMVAVVLLIPGYRNWILTAFLIGIIGLTRVGALRIKMIPALVAVAGAGAFLGLVSIFRRAVSPQLLSSDASIERYDVEYLPGFLAQLHLGFRESIALTSLIMSKAIDFHGQPVFLADLMTLLPGERISGGRVIAQAFGAVLAGGLTPGLVGLLTAEFGAANCMIFFAAVGTVGGLIWRWCVASDRPEAAFFYGFFVVNFVLLFHRGIMKPSMVIVPLYFMGLILVLRQLMINPRTDHRPLVPRQRQI